MTEPTKTKKIKQKHRINNDMWNMFDSEIKQSEPSIECIYRQSGEREFCDCCKSILIITDEGFLACKNTTCGIIYKDPTRCGMPINPLLKESSFGCKVLCLSKSSYEMRKIRRYADWQSMPYKEKSQYEEFQRITVLAQNSGIPKMIIDDAVIYHKKISEAKTFRGINRDGIIAATIYLSCRINNYPRTATEIATMFHLDNSSATKGCKNAISIINDIEKSMNNTDKTSFCKTTPISFIDRYCSKLGLNVELTMVCKFIASLIQKNDLFPENTPHSIAAGIIYYVAQMCNLNLCKKNINVVSEISEVTINKCYKKLDTLNLELIPTPILDKYANN